MKFRRMLAALLTAMMTISCFSFTAGAQEAETEADIPAIEEVAVEEAEEEAQEEAPAEEEEPEEVVEEEAALAEETTEETTEEETTEEETPTTGTGVIVTFDGEIGGLGDGAKASRTQYYDAVNDVVFYRFENTDTYELQWNAYTFGKPKVDTIDGTVNAAYRMRSNYSATPRYNIYQGYLTETDFAAYREAGGTKTENKQFGGGSFYGTAATKGDETWETTTAAFTPVYSSTELGISGMTLEYFNQIQTYLAGNSSSKEAGVYFDVAIAVIANDEASAIAEAENTENYSSEYDVSFDLNYTNAPAIEGIPTENPTRDGIEFKGWSTDKNAATGDVTDLTCMPVPTENTTYYAIWDNAAVTFNRRNGASGAITTTNIGIGEAIAFPEDPTYMSHKFLGWSTEKNNKETIIEDTSSLVVTSDMVESGITYYAVWESTHDSTQPLYYVTAQKNDANMAAEGGIGSILYDADNDIVYKHFVQDPEKDFGPRCNMYGLIRANLAYTTDVDELYFVYYLRTNITGNKPYVNFNSTTNKDGSVPGTFHQSASKLNYTVTNAGETPEWQKITFKFSGMSELGIVEHMDFNAVGKDAVHDDGEYFDISVIAIFDNAEAAESFDPAAASQVDRVTVSFDTYGGNETYESVQVKSGTYSTDLVPFPETAPTKENYTFKGWAEAKHGTVLDTSAVTVPSADTTYYAVWEMADPAEASDTVYLYQASGCDECNNGYSATYPVATIVKARELLAADGMNKLVIIGEYWLPDKNYGFGYADKTITICGYDDTSMFALDDGLYANGCANYNDERLILSGPVTFDDIIFNGDDNDGRIETNGYKLTFGDGVVLGSKGGENNNVSIAVQAIPTGTTAELEINGGTVNRLLTGTFNGGTVNGTTNVKVAGENTVVSNLTICHNYNGTAERYGIINVTVDGGKVALLGLTPTGHVSVASYDGLRYFTINGGTVETVELTGLESKTGVIKGVSVTKSATLQSGVTIVEINGGTVGTINRSASTIDDTAGVVIFNNDTYQEGIVKDSTATVIIAENGTIKAQTTEAYASTATAAEIQEWCKTVEITGYSYTTDASNKYININGTNYQLSDFTNVDATLAEETTVLIPANLFGEGENIATFSEEPLYTITWKNGDEAVKTELVAEGTVPTAPVLEEYGKFLTWDPAVTSVTGDATYTAVWAEATVQSPIYIKNIASNPSLYKWIESYMNASGANKTYRDDAVSGKWYTTFTGAGVAPHFTPDSTHFTGVTVTNGVIYAALDIKTSIPVTPKIQIRGKDAYTVGEDSTTTVNEELKEFKAETTKGDNTWERVVIKIGNTGDTPIDKLTSISSIALYLNENKVEAAQRINFAAIAFFNDEYSAREAIISAPSTVKFSIDGTVTNTAPQAAPEKDGYVFKGWSLSENGDIVSDIDFTYLNHNGTYYAVWTAKEYDVTFNAGDGTFESGKEVTVKATFDSAISAPTEVPTREGYTFAGWTPEVGTLTTEGASFTATWTLNKYTITFDAGEGAFSDGEKTKTVSADHGTTPEFTEVPTLAGHTFAGWDPELTAITAAGATYTAKWTANSYTVTYKVDGEAYGDPDTYAYGADVTMREAPEKEGYTFSGWDKTLTTMPAENVEINGVFTEEEHFPTSATYKTYGAYNELNDTYTVELKFSGAKVNQGSFGFKFPTEYMTFKSVAVNETAGIEFLGNISPIYATGEGYYADTWAITNMENAGNVDATSEEVLIATFTFGMTKDQRAAFETALAGENYKFEEYVVDNADAKYHNGTGYLATLYSTGFDTTKTAIAYASHTDEEVAPKVTYTTYGTYDEYKGTYTIDIKVKGAKINLGAFGLAFNADHMTFDPEAGNAVVLADNIANYLGITLHSGADGYAFAFDGSSQTDGYIDATVEEVLIATLNLTMTPEQRAAFVEAGKTMNLLVPTTSETVDADTLAKYFDGENYLVSIYVPGLATPKLPATYAKHNDEAIEATVADVKVEVTFASKSGVTAANIAQIKLDDGAAVALEAVGNEEKTLTYTFEALEIGKTYTVTVEKNGYLAGVAEIEVIKGTNEITMTLVAGDIKDSATAVSGNGTIDLSDFVRVIRAFDEDASSSFKSTVDIDESEAVNVTDISIIKANFNKTTADNTVVVNGTEYTPAA